MLYIRCLHDWHRFYCDSPSGYTYMSTVNHLSVSNDMNCKLCTTHRYANRDCSLATIRCTRKWTFSLPTICLCSLIWIVNCQQYSLVCLQENFRTTVNHLSVEENFRTTVDYLSVKKKMTFQPSTICLYKKMHFNKIIHHVFHLSASCPEIDNWASTWYYLYVHGKKSLLALKAIISHLLTETDFVLSINYGLVKLVRFIYVLVVRNCQISLANLQSVCC